jgi:hypothetical protein
MGEAYGVDYREKVQVGGLGNVLADNEDGGAGLLRRQEVLRLRLPHSGQDPKVRVNSGIKIDCFKLGWANIRHIFNIRIMNIFDLLFKYSIIIRIVYVINFFFFKLVTHFATN